MLAQLSAGTSLRSACVSCHSLNSGFFMAAWRALTWGQVYSSDFAVLYPFAEIHSQKLVRTPAFGPKPLKLSATHRLLVAKTPCPHCKALVRVPKHGDEAVCPECLGLLQFVEVPDRPCDGCGGTLALPPGQKSVTCGSCGLLQAAEAGRGVVLEAKCPRCRRRLTAKIEAPEVECGACGSRVVLEQP